MTTTTESDESRLGRLEGQMEQVLLAIQDLRQELRELRQETPSVDRSDRPALPRNVGHRRRHHRRPGGPDSAGRVTRRDQATCPNPWLGRVTN